MTQKKAFTGRARRLTNRGIVKFSDWLAKVFITIGGVGTIVAVMLVFVFLFIVAIPLFFPTYIISERRTPLVEKSPPLLFEIGENGTFAWKLSGDGKLGVERLDTSEEISSQSLFDGVKVRSACSPTVQPKSPSIFEKWLDLVVGLEDGRVAIGRITEKFQYFDVREVPEESRGLEVGAQAAYEGGIIAKTTQGIYRAQKVEASFGEPTALAESPIVALDFERGTTSSKLAALTEAGDLVLAEITETENVATGEMMVELNKQSIEIEKRSSGKPRDVFLMGLGSTLAVLWEDGFLVRYDLTTKPVKLIEEKSLLTGSGVRVTSAITLQGRETLLVGDSSGVLRAWFSARVHGGAKKSLVMAHELPAMKGAIRSLARSRTVRMVVAGTTEGEVGIFHVTTDRQLLQRTPFDQPVERVAISRNDDEVIALTAGNQWQARLDPRHPEATLAALFRPVWYEGYDRPLEIWQSSAGSDDPEPKYGLLPLIFGTFKATFYSMLFGAPIAILAAIYTSEFIETRLKSPIKSSIEMMASLPSVVLGFLAGLVFAPFVEKVLPSLLGSFLVVPFLFLCGAHAWQLLPHKLALQWAKYRLAIILLLMLIGLVASMMIGPLLERVLFAGDMKAWLDGRIGSGASGWFILLMPLCVIGAATIVNVYINPWMRDRFGKLSRFSFASLNLAKFLLAATATFAIAYLFGLALTAAGFDSRGGFLDKYEQRNALVVGFVMGFAIIPIIYTISEDALSTVPQHLRSASLGCGATVWQTTWRVVIPTAASGLFSAVMVGLGRAVGETMIMLMATGNVPIMDLNIFNGFRSLSANVAEELPEAPPWSTHFRILFFTALVLLTMTFVINTAAEAIRISFRRRARQL